jgi:nucleotidyltransferase substrate binding protein (TIGR01987 family)
VTLDISSLESAIDRLEEGLARYRKDVSDAQIRDGLIQRFEFTYELSHKMLKRYLEATSANATEFDPMAFQDLIRTGNERGLLLGDWPAWRTFRDMRNAVSQAYNEAKALSVVAGVEPFLEEAKFLRDQLKRRGRE